MVRPLCSLLIFSAVLACGGDEPTGESSGSTAVGSNTASADSSSEESASSAETEETGETGTIGDEYRDCDDVADCPEGMLYACLGKVTAGHVCAPGCEATGECPPPPPGGTVVPVCTTVDNRQRCLLALCETDDDCPTGMTCHLEGPNWCHWPN